MESKLLMSLTDSINKSANDEITKRLLIEDLREMFYDETYKVNIDYNQGLVIKETIDDLFKKLNQLIDFAIEKSISKEDDDESLLLNTVVRVDQLVAEKTIRTIETVSSSNVMVLNGTYTLNSHIHNKTNPSANEIFISTCGMIGDTRRGYLDSTGGIKFQGESNPMASVSGFLNDSMCTIEMFNSKPGDDVTADVLYKEGISCIAKEDVLTASISFKWHSPVRANVISFSDNSRIPFYITDIVVRDKDNNITLYDVFMLSNWTNMINIKTVDLKEVTINVLQKTAATESIVCSSGGAYIGSISSTGMHIKNGIVVHQTLNQKDIHVDDLFQNTYERKLAIASRYSISMGSLVSKNIEYETEGIIVRKICTFDFIESVTINASEEISDTQDIEYFISKDNKYFEKVVPISRAQLNDIYTIIFKKSSSRVSHSSKYLSSSRPLKEFYIKMVLKTDSKESSPVIKKLLLDIKGANNDK